MHASAISLSKGLPQLLLLAVMAALAACEQAASGPGIPMPALPEVVIGHAAEAAVPLNLSYTAQTLGSREVEVRARVSGILLKRLYQEGNAVKQGDVLFQIDPAPFEAAVAQDRAALAIARANQTQARRNRDRIVPLVEKGLASPKERDDVLSGLEVADAQAQAAEASLRTSELNLSYTKVRAPISGIASREARSEGSLVTAGSDSSLLTRIVQLQPLYVEFAAPEQEAVAVRALWSRQHNQGVRVSVAIEGSDAQQASLSFIDNSVDASSGTVRMRAVLDNRQRKLWPGQYVRVQFDELSVSQAIAIPRRAVLSSTQGYMVWVLDANNTAQSRLVKLGPAVGDSVLISDGLKAGDRYVLDGLFKVQAGATLKPVEAASVASPAAGKA
jgi:membrane fusion protein (multidrug efflux system)